jgi:hypothetical protein
MDGYTYSNNNRQFVYIDAPLLKSLSPQNGPASGGTMVTIRGENFSSIGDLTCKFGDSPSVNAIFVNDKTLRCLTPGGAPSSNVRVRVSNHRNQFVMGDSLHFQYQESVDVSNIYPIRGAVCGGTMVTILGNNFRESKYLKCKFGDKITPASFVSEHTIKCAAPGHAVGEVSVFTSNNNHNFVDSGFTFTFFGNVVVSKIVPPSFVPNVGEILETPTLPKKVNVNPESTKL